MEKSDPEKLGGPTEEEEDVVKDLRRQIVELERENVLLRESGQTMETLRKVSDLERRIVNSRYRVEAADRMASAAQCRNQI